jgi:hypothetical protein
MDALVAGAERRLAWRRRFVATGAAFAVGLIAVGGWLGARELQSGKGAGPASSPTVTATSASDDNILESVRGLTGKDVGLALGLTPITTSAVHGCQEFAEYTNGAGFCLDPIDLPKADVYTIMNQIAGRGSSDEEDTLVRLKLELSRLVNAGETDSARVRELEQRIAELTAGTP